MIDFTTSGRLLSPSKSLYRTRHPSNFVVFDATLCTRSKKLWWGDLDITLDQTELQRLAAELSEDLYVLREYAGRFDPEETMPKLDRTVARITRDGIVHITE